MKSNISNTSLRSIAMAMFAAFFLASPAPTARAAIDWSNDVNPSDPTTWTTYTTGYIGDTFLGTITIDGGSGLLSYYGYVGNSVNGIGSVTVSGTGSNWTNSNALFLGNFGHGTLYIEAGGRVSNANAFLGYYLESVGTATITGAGSKWTNSGELNIGCTGNGTLNILDGGQVSNTNALVAIQGGSVSTVTVSGAGSKWTNMGGLAIGLLGNGTLDVEAGGQVSSTSNELGLNAGSNGTATITGAGSKWNYSSWLNVGNNGNGTLNILNGGQVSDATSNPTGNYLGYRAGSTGTATVSGSGSLWTSNSYLYVGYLGSGTLTVADGGTVTVTKGIFASFNDLAGDGTITTNGAVLDTDLVFDATHGLLQTFVFGTNGSLILNQNGSGILGAGYKRTGTLRIADGKTVVCSSSCLGYHTDSVGTATVTGVGSKWTNNGSLHVGFYGSGTFNIEAGGQVSNTAPSDLGYYVGSSGTATITGVGSKWTCKGLGVGVGGSGILKIKAGGQVSNTGSTIGVHAAGTATVTGAGSSWAQSGDLQVGSWDSGTLNIEAGGQVSNAIGYAGYNSGSTGSITVIGVGSKWINNSALNVGYSGSAMLNIKDGGQVTSQYGYLGANSGSSGTVTVTGKDSEWNNTHTLIVGRSGIGTLNIGSDSNSGGLVSAQMLALTNTSDSVGICNLCGGKLQVGFIVRGTGLVDFNWQDGTIQNFNASTDLTIDSLELKLAATGTHAFNIDAGRSGMVNAVLSDATSGGTLTKMGDGLLTLKAANNYTGDTTVEGGTLSIRIPYLNDLSDIHISLGAKLDLGFVGIDTVGSLYLDGLQADFGTWGSSSSGAAHIDNIHFSGTGMLNVVPEPSTLALLGMSGIGLIAYGWRRRTAQRIVVCFIALLASTAGMAKADTFGTGANQFTLDFVPISGATNPLSGIPAGTNFTFTGVAYDYRMGTYEITNSQWNKFKTSLGVPLTGTPSSAYDNNAYYTGTNVSTGCVSWHEAAQFVNWLNTSKGHQAAYKFIGTQGTSDYTFAPWDVADSGYDPSNPFRNTAATYFLPSENEWVKAAYWNGTSLQTYATKPGESLFQGTGKNGIGWNYASDIYAGLWAVGSGSQELNNTYDMMGNVWEWMEGPWISGDYGSTQRVARGGSYGDPFPSRLGSSYRNLNDASSENSSSGFRVASVPEPSTLAFLFTATLGGLLWRRRKR